jgi:hypothetical protein
MGERLPDKLPKYQRAKQSMVKEFWARDPENVRSTGRVIIRANNYGSSLAKFDELFDTLQQDMLQFEPPIALDREDVEIVKYGGYSYKNTFGIEVTIPEGHVLPEEYRRIPNTEALL